MHLRSILALNRPTHQPEAWLPEVLEWLPAASAAMVNTADETMALVHNVGNGRRRTLFACHLDTVHRTTGNQRVRQRRGQPGILYSPDGECLGADDGAGLWLMLQLIAADVPGTYVFHLHEEAGCRGSRWLAKQHPAWLVGFDRAIGFDRPGTRDVVTHFGGLRGCSTTFAETLSTALSANLDGYTLTPCDAGGLTDVRHYIGLIPECTNLSVGYHRQHGPHEWLDTRYLIELRAALIRVLGPATSLWQ